MATFVFDTHRAVKDLEEAGFPEAQAEALVEIVGLAVGENAATKGDLDAMERRLEAEFTAQGNPRDDRFTAFEQRMDDRFTAFEQRMEARFTAFEQRMEARFTAFEHSMEVGFLAIRSDLRAMERRLTLKLIAILLPSMGLLFAALRFLT